MSVLNDSVKHRYLYVLKLEGGNFYIGQTTEQFEKRLKKHFSGKGSAWTKKHKPLVMIELIDLGETTYTIAEDKENECLIRYMEKYGWEKVRGGHLSNSDEENHLKSLKSHQRRKTIVGLEKLNLVKTESI